MTKYPNSECEAHRDVKTSQPVCIVCMANEIEQLQAECDRRKDYIIHLLHKQAIVVGLNEQDKEWLRSFAFEVAESV